MNSFNNIKYLLTLLTAFSMFILGFRIFVPVLLAIIKQPAKLVLPQKDIVVCVTPDSRVRIVKLVRKIQFSDFFFFHRASSNHVKKVIQKSPNNKFFHLEEMNYFRRHQFQTLYGHLNNSFN